MNKKNRDIPIYDFPMIETHFHLEMLKASQDELMAKCRIHNIDKLITISTQKNNLDEVILLTLKYQELYCSQGVHPHSAVEWDDEIKKHLLNNLETHKKIVAIGEIGLDYYYLKSTRQQQINAFEQQLQMAVDQNLPVIIHSRNADDDTIDILKNFSTSLKRKGVLHSFTSGLPLANYALSENFYLGFNGIITFKSADNVKQALGLTPLNRILVETDAPFLTPDPYRGVENAPCYLPFIVEKIAELKNQPIQNILQSTYQNALDLFWTTP